MIGVFLVLASLCLLSVQAQAAGPHDVSRMMVDELEAKMDRGEDIVIIDVRTMRSYMSSGVKLPAHRAGLHIIRGFHPLKPPKDPLPDRVRDKHLPRSFPYAGKYRA